MYIATKLCHKMRYIGLSIIGNGENTGRGANHNPINKFDKNEEYTEFDIPQMEEQEDFLKTSVIKTYPKTIVNKVDSPDIGFQYSLNPYQGCEHGCTYCYARNSHNYWGYSSGLDFESKLLVKENAPELLVKKFSEKSWNPEPIMLSGNTDCYQPIEKKYEITRKLLQVFLKYKHPVSIITKNSLILRDLDILKDLASQNLVSVAMSINTLEDKLRQKLEPRASTISKRWDTLCNLAENNIPTIVVAAPMIPGLNDHEAIDLVKKAADVNVYNVYPIVLRLNGDLPILFTSWLAQYFPDRKDKVLNKIASMHGGKLQNNEFGARMKGSGKIAEIIHQQFNLAKKIHGLGERKFKHNCEIFIPPGGKQMGLFD
jgi:DNA repair photolyase